MIRRRAVLGGALAAPFLARRSWGSAAETLTRVAGQLIMTGFAGREPGQPGVEVAARQIEQGRIGGVLLLDRNIRSPDQLRRLTARLGRGAQPFIAVDQPRDPSALLIDGNEELRRLTARLGRGAQPFIAVDQEGGRVARLRRRGGFAHWESAASVARRMSPVEAEGYYAGRARDLAALGITLNLGPVVDLDLGGPAIGALGRAYGPDPASVVPYAEAFVRAHRAAGVATSLKHFPGHGSATLDSHRVLPDIGPRWRGAEMEPFRALAAAGLADMVMTAHLSHPAFSDAPDMPSSLSVRAIDALRATGFRGVVVTDDLEMRAVSDAFGPEEAAVRAIAAGNDMVIFSTYGALDRALGPRVNAAIVQALRDGRLTEGRVARSYAAVMALKARLRASR